MQYILLNAFSLNDFSLETADELKEAAQEFGCDILESKNLSGFNTYYLTSKTKAALEQLCGVHDLPGVVVEATAIYDQFELV